MTGTTRIATALCVVFWGTSGSAQVVGAGGAPAPANRLELRVRDDLPLPGARVKRWTLGVDVELRLDPSLEPTHASDHTEYRS